MTDVLTNLIMVNISISLDITLHILNLYSVILQIYLNKAEEEE